MNITIIGAGAMGSLFGSFLVRTGESVLLVDTWQEHVNAINTRGLGVEFNGKIKRVDIVAAHDIPADGKSDLVIIFVKSTQTEQVAPGAVKCLKSNGFVLTLQNGMGNADGIAKYVPLDRVIAGTTSHGATLLEPGLIRHAGVGPTVMGMWSEKSNAGLENIKELFLRAGIDTRIDDNIPVVIWKKLVINIGINAITALTGIRNGSILDAPPTGELVRSAVEEACKVALAHGVELPDNMADQVFKVAKATGSNRSSMGQDVDNRRQTEIDAINGAIVTLAEEKAISVPVNKTLTALIQTVQKNYNNKEN